MPQLDITTAVNHHKVERLIAIMTLIDPGKNFLVVYQESLSDRDLESSMIEYLELDIESLTYYDMEKYLVPYLQKIMIEYIIEKMIEEDLVVQNKIHKEISNQVDALIQDLLKIHN